MQGGECPLVFQKTEVHGEGVDVEGVVTDKEGQGAQPQNDLVFSVFGQRKSVLEK